MGHPPYLSPEQKFLRTIYISSLSAVEPLETFASWLLTGVAGILGLLLVNIESVAKIITSEGLKWGIGFLTISMLTGVLAKQFGVAIRNAMAVTEALYAEVLSAEGQAILESITTSQQKIFEEMARPFLWPLNVIMLKAAQAGSVDYLTAEKRNVKLFCLQTYISYAQAIAAAIGILVISFAIQ